MKRFRYIFQILTFSAWLLATNCATEEPQTEDGIAAVDSNNQTDTPVVDDGAGQQESNLVTVAREGEPSPSDTDPDHSGTEPSKSAILAATESAANAESSAETAPQLPSDSLPNPGEVDKADQPVASSAPSDQLPSLPQIIAEGELTERPEALMPEKKLASQTGTRRHATAKRIQPAASAGEKTYIVQPGDSLSLIAKMIFGNSSRWPELAARNSLKGNSHIYPGDILHYASSSESVAFEEKIENLKRHHVNVKKSDTLASIAARVMGNPAYWKLLWRWNEALVVDPQKIFKGQRLEYVDPKELSALHSGRNTSKSAH